MTNGLDPLGLNDEESLEYTLFYDNVYAQALIYYHINLGLPIDIARRRARQYATQRATAKVPRKIVRGPIVKTRKPVDPGDALAIEMAKVYGCRGCGAGWGMDLWNWGEHYTFGFDLSGNKKMRNTLRNIFKEAASKHVSSRDSNWLPVWLVGGSGEKERTYFQQFIWQEGGRADEWLREGQLWFNQLEMEQEYFYFNNKGECMARYKFRYSVEYFDIMDLRQFGEWSDDERKFHPWYSRFIENVGDVIFDKIIDAEFTFSAQWNNVMTIDVPAPDPCNCQPQ